MFTSSFILVLTLPLGNKGRGVSWDQRIAKREERSPVRSDLLVLRGENKRGVERKRDRERERLPRSTGYRVYEMIGFVVLII